MLIYLRVPFCRVDSLMKQSQELETSLMLAEQKIHAQEDQMKSLQQERDEGEVGFCRDQDRIVADKLMNPDPLQLDVKLPSPRLSSRQS